MPTADHPTEPLADLAQVLPADALIDHAHGAPPARGWLGWVVSGTIHASVLVLMGTIIFAQAQQTREAPPMVTAAVAAAERKPPKPVDRLERTPQPERMIETTEPPNPHTIVEITQEQPATEDPEDRQAPKGRDDAMSDREMGGPGMCLTTGYGGGNAGMFGDRVGGGRKRIHTSCGPSIGSVTAVDQGLRWLKRHQDRASGAWDPSTYSTNCEEDPKCEPGASVATHGIGGSAKEASVAMTGYALLCFLGEGFDHRSGPYKSTVRKGIEHLLSQQQPDGAFGASNYVHPVAAMAIFEAYGMTKDPELREPSERALKIILDRQTKEANARDPAYARLGWDYSTPNPTRQDSSVSGWNVMALKSADGADLGSAKEGLDGARVWLERAWKAANQANPPKDAYGDSVFPYTWNPSTGAADHQAPSNVEHDLTSVGMACAVFLGHEAGDPMLETMANHVMKHQKPSGWSSYNSYYTYYSTMGMFQVGGAKWDEWNKSVRDFLVGAQRKEDGCFKGSWNWQEGVKWHGSETGRVLSTCYAILNLQVYYRYDLAQGRAKAGSRPAAPPRPRP